MSKCASHFLKNYEHVWQGPTAKFRDTGEEGPHHWDQLYLTNIRYVNYADDQAHPQRSLQVRRTADLAWQRRTHGVLDADIPVPLRWFAQQAVLRRHAQDNWLRRLSV